MTNSYIHNALKGQFFGLNNLNSTKEELALSQLAQLNSTVYPKLDLKVMDLLQYIL